MRKKILVAEDDPSLQEIFQLLLRKRGYDVELILNPGVIRQHGGTIRVHSEPGRGSAFTVELPKRS
jgi:K+-sensing histidine kinase KdpD